VVAGVRGGATGIYVRVFFELPGSIRHGEVVHLLRMVVGNYDQYPGADDWNIDISTTRTKSGLEQIEETYVA
jgi:hypothetical protein